MGLKNKEIKERRGIEYEKSGASILVLPGS